MTVPGSVIPYPYGGKQRQVMINLNPSLLQSKGMSPSDVLNSVAMQYLVLPAGTAKIPCCRPCWSPRLNMINPTIATTNTAVSISTQ